MRTPGGKLFVENIEQRALFELELKGQLSDGHWENSYPSDHWHPWCDAEVVVAPPGQPVGRAFYAKRDRYALRSKDLLETVGGRMITLVRMVRGLGWADAEKVKNRAGCDSDFKVSLNMPSDPADPSGYWKGERVKLNLVGLNRINAALADESYGKRELLRDLRRLSEIMKTSSLAWDDRS